MKHILVLGPNSQICNFRSRSWIPNNIFIISTFNLLSAKCHKNQAHCNIEAKSAQIFNYGTRFAILNIIFMFKELDLLWVPNFIALGIHIIFGTKFSRNEGIDTCFNPIKPGLFQASVSPGGRGGHFCLRQINPYNSSSIYS